MTINAKLKCYTIIPNEILAKYGVTLSLQHRPELGVFGYLYAAKTVGDTIKRYPPILLVQGSERSGIADLIYISTYGDLKWNDKTIPKGEMSKVEDQVMETLEVIWPKKLRYIEVSTWLDELKDAK